jgi:hypothetical protein
MYNKNQIASILIMVQDQKFATHSEWLRNVTAQMEHTGALEKAWNGEIGKFNPDTPDALAWIDNSRWLVTCPFCGNKEGVDPNEAILFCMNCDMLDNNYMALPVVFPDKPTASLIEAVLLERPVTFVPAPTKYERIVRQTPIIFKEINGQLLGLGRCWTPNQSIEDLHAEQDELISAWRNDQ